MCVCVCVCVSVMATSPSAHSLWNNAIGDVGREALREAAKEKGTYIE